MSEFNPVTKAILEQFTAVLSPTNLSTAEAERQLRARDMSKHPPRLSDVVVWPETAEQTAAVLKIANENHIPVTAWGAGSSLEGNPIPLYGGISLSMERMNRIRAVHADDFQVTVQPGLGYKDLNESLARYGLFFAPDPGANASIGGMLANNAAGSRTVKYGASKDNVLALEVALADGRLIRTGSRSIKQSAGYNLTQLIIGSEGTLGIITEATLKLAPIPTIMSSLVVNFENVESAVQTVVAIRGSGLDVAALEFVDGKSAAIATRENGVNWGSLPTLLIEVHAAHAETADLDIALIREICEEYGAARVQATTDTAERKQMWQARHHLFETKVRVYPGNQWYIMDVAVPISAYPELIAFANEAFQTYQIEGSLIGHAGDGNLHVEMPYQNEETRIRVSLANDAIVDKAITLDGTSTGEHGVGIGKAKFMQQEHGPALDVMHRVKHLLDPNGILNPGKILIH
jgi:D-lactate dehydrogenase (cytochrome)